MLIWNVQCSKAGLLPSVTTGPYRYNDISGGFELVADGSAPSCTLTRDVSSSIAGQLASTRMDTVFTDASLVLTCLSGTCSPTPLVFGTDNAGNISNKVIANLTSSPLRRYGGKRY